MHGHVDIVFDGHPGPEGGRLVEIEDSGGRSIKFGEWIERKDGTWVLRITPADFRETRGSQ
jgi:hypothetical protein